MGLIRKKRTNRRFVNGPEGVISIMLAILMLPFFSVAALLVEAERYQSAVSLLDESMGSASLSVLADYDTYTFQRFGLMSVSPKADVGAAYNDFLRYNSENISRSAEIKSVFAEGEYPLADLDILSQQIQEYGKLNVPLTLADETLNLSELIKSLEELTKITNILKTITAGAKTADGLKQVKAEMDNFKEAAKACDDVVKQYASAFSDWQSAVDDLNSAIDAGEKEDMTEDEAEAAQTAINSARSKMITARDHYAQICREIADQAGKVWDAKTKLVNAIQSVKDSAADFASSAVNSVSEVQRLQSQIDKLDEKIAGTEDEAEKDSLEKQYKELLVQKAENQVTSDVSDSVNNGAKAILDAAGDHVNKFTIEIADKVKKDFRDQAAKTDAYSAAGAPETPGEADYHYAKTEGIPTENDIVKIIAELDDLGASGNFMALVQGLIAVVNGLLETDILYNPACSAVIDKSFYTGSMGGLPSNVHPEVSDPFFAMFDNLSAFFAAVGKLGADAVGLKIFSKIDDICTVVEAMCKYVDSLISFITQMVNRIRDILSGNFDSVFNMTYFAYNLPNRLDIKRNGKGSGSTMSDYPFAKEDGLRNPPVAYGALGVSDIGAAIGTIKAMLSGGKDYRFDGAELEYIMFGANAEILNQTYAFFGLYFIRVILDIVPILLNKEVQMMTKAPFVGVIILVIELLAEPFVDTVLLVNGEKINLLKKTIFLTPSGLKELMKKVVNLESDLVTSKMKGIKADLEVKFDMADEVSENPEDNDKDENKDSLLGKHAKGLLDLSYKDHMFAIMMLIGNEDTYIYRLADLVQMDGYTYWKKQDPSVSYNINHAYTFIHSASDIGFNQLLPVPSLSSDSFFDVTRELYRGY